MIPITLTLLNTMTITGLLRNKSDLPPAAAPTSVRTVSVPAGCGTGEVYRDGCLLHAALAGDGNVEFAAVVDAIRREVHTCGGKFIRTEQLEKDGTTRKCIVWSKPGLLLAKAEDITTKISERDDKNYSTQVYAEMDLGAVRMEDEKVLQLQCKEGA